MATKDKIVNLEDLKVLSDHVEGEVTDLKSDFNQLENSVAIVTEETVTEQISVTWTDGQYITANGQQGSNSNLMLSSSIAVQKGDVIKLHRASDGYNINTYRYLAAYNNGTITSLGGESGSLPYTVPSGVDSIRVTVSLAYGTGSTASKEVINKTITPILEQRVSEAESDIQNAENQISELYETTTEEAVSYESVPLSLTWTSGYVGANGTVNQNASYNYSNKIAVSEGDKVFIYRESDGRPISSARFLTAYHDGTAITEKGAQSVTMPYVVPSGVDEIVFSILADFGNATGENLKYTVTLVPKGTADVPALNNIIASKKKNCLDYSFNLASNGTFTSTEEFEDICGYRICLFAKISSFSGEIKIGKGIGAAYGCGIGIDATNLYEYLAETVTPSRTQAHGLTFSDYISVVIDAHYKQNATVTVSTNGGSYTWEIPYWFSSKGSLSVSSAVALTNCNLSYTCEGITKETWLYGDSYFNNGTTNRWTSYLVKGDYTNYLLNGFAGRNSLQAMASLKVDLSMGRVPRRIVWCLGMNDKDTATTANVIWSKILDELIDICEQNRIELILATIPNVPSTAAKNDFKNEVVRNSGYRYIDFANAISADGSSTWYDNMLSSDNVHPDVQGAIALYSCAVAEVPELLF